MLIDTKSKVACVTEVAPEELILLDLQTAFLQYSTGPTESLAFCMSAPVRSYVQNAFHERKAICGKSIAEVITAGLGLSISTVLTAL